MKYVYTKAFKILAGQLELTNSRSKAEENIEKDKSTFKLEKNTVKLSHLVIFSFLHPDVRRGGTTFFLRIESLIEGDSYLD